MSVLAELRTVGARAARRTVRPRHQLPRGQAGVALTFDDGPDPRTTPQVLDLLAAGSSKATFFLVGERAERHPHLVERIAADGHAVGSHSWSHPRPWDLSVQQLVQDYGRGHDAVQQVLGRPTSLFRPPHGHLGKDSLLALLRLRLRPVLWTHDPEDWRDGVTADQLVERLTGLRERDVVLLHDALVVVDLEEVGGTASSDEERAQTIEALPRILDALASACLAPVPWPRA